MGYLCGLSYTIWFSCNFVCICIGKCVEINTVASVLEALENNCHHTRVCFHKAHIWQNVTETTAGTCSRVLSVWPKLLWSGFCNVQGRFQCHCKKLERWLSTTAIACCLNITYSWMYIQCGIALWNQYSFHCLKYGLLHIFANQLLDTLTLVMIIC